MRVGPHLAAVVAIVLALPAAARAAPLGAASPTPLVIIDKALVETPTGPKIRITLENQSGKIITAWRLVDLLALNSGRESRVVLSEDHLSLFPPDGEPLPWPEVGGPFAPGEQRIFHFGPSSGRGRFAAQSIEVTAVVFDDASAEGFPGEVAELLDYRRALVTETERLLTWLDELPSGLDSGSARDRLRAALDTTPDGDYVRLPLGAAVRTLETGGVADEALEVLRLTLEDTNRLARAHLPEGER